MIKQYFSDFKVKIIVYLRRHDKWWPSAYQQSIKQVAFPPWESNFRSFWAFQESQPENLKYWYYKRLLEKWSVFFGKENIMVRVFEGCQIKEGVISDFFQAINAKAIYQELIKNSFQNEKTNKSINSISAQLIDIYQRLDIDKETKAKLLDHAYTKNSKISVNSLCSIELLNDITKSFYDDYEYIANEYLGRDDGILFYEPLDEEKKEKALFIKVEYVVYEALKALNGEY